MSLTFLGLCNYPYESWFDSTLPAAGVHNATRFRGNGFSLILDTLRLAGIPPPKINIVLKESLKLKHEDALKYHRYVSAIAFGEVDLVPNALGDEIYYVTSC